jgi:hypothetical protein
MDIIEGQKIHCKLSAKEINLKTDDYLYFPKIIVNKKSPVYFLNDSFLLSEFLNNHKLKGEILSYLAFHERATENIDFVTKERLKITNFDNPENILEVPILTLRAESPVYKYNRILINKKNLLQWTGRSHFIAELQVFGNSEEWEGSYIKELINEISNPTISPPLKDWMLEDIKKQIKDGKAQWWMVF